MKLTHTVDMLMCLQHVYIFMPYSTTQGVVFIEDRITLMVTILFFYCTVWFVNMQVSKSIICNFFIIKMLMFFLCQYIKRVFSCFYISNRQMFQQHLLVFRKTDELSSCICSGVQSWSFKKKGFTPSPQHSQVQQFVINLFVIFWTFSSYVP